MNKDHVEGSLRSAMGQGEKGPKGLQCRPELAATHFRFKSKSNSIDN